MKHRIVKEGDRYYPQRKGWLGWSYYTEHGACIDGLPYTETISFSTLGSALKFFEPRTSEVVWRDDCGHCANTTTER